jgi:UPF0716 protein FxsA
MLLPVRFSCTFNRLDAAKERQLPASIRMSLPKWLLFAVLALPVAELAVFIVVAVQVGLLGAFALLLATSLLGIVLLKMAGRGHIAHIRVRAAEDGIVGLGGPGFFVAISGILLVLPGFLTDALGLLVLLPPVQRGLRAALGRVLRQQSGGPGGGSRDGVVDLAPDEWAEDETTRPPRNDLPKP